MANVKISALPSTTTSTFDDWLVKNNSGETTTEKVQLKNVLGMTSLNGNNAIQSSSWLTNLGTTATTQSSIAIGNGAEATSPYSIAIGYEALNFNRDGGRDYYTAIGYQARSVQGGTAIGKNANAAGGDATSIGQNAQTFGNAAFAMGNNSTAASTNGVAIGSNASDTSNNSSVVIGDTASSTADYSVAIGRNTSVTHENSSAIGNGVSSVFSATTHVGSLYVGDNNSYQVATLTNLSSFAVDWNTASSYQITLNQNASVNFSNFRDGGRYLLYINNTGTHNITGVTTTAGTVFFDDNGQKNITHNGKDLWVVTPFGNTQLVQQVQNFA